MLRVQKCNERQPAFTKNLWTMISVSEWQSNITLKMYPQSINDQVHLALKNEKYKNEQGTIQCSESPGYQCTLCLSNSPLGTGRSIKGRSSTFKKRNLNSEKHWTLYAGPPDMSDQLQFSQFSWGPSVLVVLYPIHMVLNIKFWCLAWNLSLSQIFRWLDKQQCLKLDVQGNWPRQMVGHPQS